MIHSQMCYTGDNQCEISNAGEDLSVSDSTTFPWLLMIFQSSMTFPENFIFPGFQDPVRTRFFVFLHANYE